MPVFANHSAWTSGPQHSAVMPAGFSDNPTKDYASFSSPWEVRTLTDNVVDIRQMFKFGEFLWKHDPTFQRALARVIGYFMTNIEFYDPSHTANIRDEDINNYREVLNDQLNIRSVLQAVLTDLCVLGNALVTMIPPIQRRLECPDCHLILPANIVMSPDNPKFQFKYKAKGVQFEATCPNCSYKGAWNMYTDAADFRRYACIQRFNPHEFILHHDPFTGQGIYVWQIPAWLKRRIENGDPVLLASTPTSVLEAIGENKDYRFDSDMILHLREETISSINTGGWGLPRAIDSYRLSRYVFSLRHMNEVLAADYMVPVRLLSPSKVPDNGGYSTSDTGWTVDMNDWNSQVKQFWAAHRKDPTTVHTIGLPVTYQILGGEAKSLVPGEMLAQAEADQLNAMGFPAQMYKGDLSVQAAPMAARLFEQHWWVIPENANKLLTWLVGKITPQLGWKAVGARLEPPKIADNMDHLMLLMQMVDKGKVADSTVLQRMGLDQTEELRKQQDAAMLQAEMEAEQQKEMDKLMAGSTGLQAAVEEERAMMAPPPPQGGAPAPAPAGAPAQGGGMMPSADPIASIMLKVEQLGNPAVPTKPQDLAALAQEAAAVLANMPEIQKRQILRDIEGKSPIIKSLITDEMTNFHKDQNRQFILQGQQAAGIAPV
jgi:hypothetical protein